MKSNLFWILILICFKCNIHKTGEIAELVDKTSSEKKQLIGKLLGLDSLKKYGKLGTNYQRTMKTQSELKGKLFSSRRIKRGI